MASFLEKKCSQCKEHQNTRAIACDKFKILLGMEVHQEGKYMEGNAVILYVDIDYNSFPLVPVSGKK